MKITEKKCIECGEVKEKFLSPGYCEDCALAYRISGTHIVEINKKGYWLMQNGDYYRELRDDQPIGNINDPGFAGTLVNLSEE